MKYELVVLDIDNTVFDWVNYYVHCMEAMIEHLSREVNVPAQQLFEEAKVVFDQEGSIEYPFLVQQLPAIQKKFSTTQELLDRAVIPCRQIFLQQAETHLKPYETVLETLNWIQSSGFKMVALTDAPRYVAMWKLKKLGLLGHFSGVYGLGDPRIPTRGEEVLVQQEILLKHLARDNLGFAGHYRVLPDCYEKPNVNGLKTILMDYGVDDRPKRVLWVGDNAGKDVELGKRVGVQAVWAKYGAELKDDLQKRLMAFAPQQSVRRHSSLGAKVEMKSTDLITIAKFSELKPILEAGCSRS